MNKSDHATQFVLAGCAISLYSYMIHGKHADAAKVVKQIGQVLAKDPTFSHRFCEMQKDVMEEFERVEKK